MNTTMTMRTPANWPGDMWREGAPCGSGRIGALVYGGVDREIILLNHAALWRGGSIQDIPDVHEALDEVRRLLDEQRPDLANPVLSSALRKKGYGPAEATPLPLCDIVLNRHSQTTHRHYRRKVEMDRAEVVVSWEEAGTKFTRELFVSRKDHRTYLRLKAEGEGKLSLTAALTCHDRETMRGDVLKNAASHAEIGEDGWCFYAADNETAYEPGNGCYGAVMRVIPKNGTMSPDGQPGGQGIRIDGADEILCVTELFVGQADREEAFAEAKLSLAGDFDYAAAMAEHLPLHRQLFDRVKLTLTVNAGEGHSNEELLLDAFDGEMSPELAERMYHYGRYLLLCSTGEGELPTHLVGLWNGTYQAFWAIYMFNVNFEMIYWVALTAGMPELLRAALDYVEAMADDFRRNARQIYGCRGIYLNSVNTPVGGRSACLADHIINWTAGAAWVSQHFYDYCRYTDDLDYLREHAMPFMAEAALFYEDFLRPTADGKLEFAPSTSPENVSATTTSLFGSAAQCSKNASMDIAAVRELLTNLLEASELTGLYAEKRETWQSLLDRLPDYRYNADGSLKEWADDFYEDFNAHRHQSHLYAVFPGRSVTPESPEFPAFVKAEDKRLAEGLNAMSSWGTIYMAGTNARMGRGDTALHALSEMTRHCCMNNLFTTHNDWRRMGSVGCDDMRLAPFQIDANIGFPAAVNEMLLGCRWKDGRECGLILFPAMPTAWESGSAEGLAAPHGITVSLRWNGNTAAVVLNGKASITIAAGSGWKFADGAETITVELPASVSLTKAE